MKKPRQLAGWLLDLQTLTRWGGCQNEEKSEERKKPGLTELRIRGVVRP